MRIDISRLPADRETLARMVRKACDELWFSFEAPLLPPIDLERERALLRRWLGEPERIEPLGD